MMSDYFTHSPTILESEDCPHLFVTELRRTAGIHIHDICSDIMFISGMRAFSNLTQLLCQSLDANSMVIVIGQITSKLKQTRIEDIYIAQFSRNVHPKVLKVLMEIYRFRRREWD